MKGQLKMKITLKNYQARELTPIDARKSFYKKCCELIAEDVKVLKSYSSYVAVIKNNSIYLNNNINDELLFSNTTLRHIRSFLVNNGFPVMAKKELIQHLTNINILEA